MAPIPQNKKQNKERKVVHTTVSVRELYTTELYLTKKYATQPHVCQRTPSVRELYKTELYLPKKCATQHFICQRTLVRELIVQCRAVFVKEVCSTALRLSENSVCQRTLSENCTTQSCGCQRNVQHSPVSAREAGSKHPSMLTRDQARRHTQKQWPLSAQCRDIRHRGAAKTGQSPPECTCAWWFLLLAGHTRP